MKRLLLFLATLTLGAGAVACSSDATPFATDGGLDAASDAAIVADAAAPADDAGCVIAAGADPFCRSLSCPGAGCNPSAECQEAKLRDCPAYASASSEAFETANVACAQTADCKSLVATDECIFSKLAAAARTTSQTNLAKHYCARCGGDAGASCETDFYARTSTVGLTLLFYSDAVIDEIDVQCTQCAAAFVDCAVPLADKKLPLRPAACK
jgi:hypothetical protein